MRASKLITISAVAVLMGGTSLALTQGIGAQGIGAQGGPGSLQNDGSMQSPGAIDQSRASSSEMTGANPGAAESPARRSRISGERGANIQGSRDSQRQRTMTSERGRAITSERGLATAAEHGRSNAGPRALATAAERERAKGGERGHATSAEQRGRAIAGQRGVALTAERGRAATSQGRQSFGQQETSGLVYARAAERNAGAGLNAEQRARLHDMLASRRDIPRVLSMADVRLNAIVPRSVRLAAVPEEIVRIYPRFRRHQAFIHRNDIVVVDPATSRIVAILRT